MSQLDPMSMAFSAATVILFILFLIVIYVRFIRPRRRGVSTGGARPASGAEAKPKKGGKPEVQIVTNGPAGTIYYFEQGHTLKTYWEFGGGDAVAIIYVPSEEKWDAQAPWAKGRRKEILDFIARQVIQQKSPGGSARWSSDYFEIVKK